MAKWTKKAQKAREHNAYHLVTRNDLIHKRHLVYVKQRAAEEFKKRVEFSKKYYKNRYDHRHEKWMGNVGSVIGLTEKLNMSLDACIVHRKIMYKRTQEY